MVSISALLPDVDECQLFQSSWQTRICVHDCVNLPGSYRCICPQGYLLNTDLNTCNGKKPPLRVCRESVTHQECLGFGRGTELSSVVAPCCMSMQGTLTIRGNNWFDNSEKGNPQSS